MQKPKRLSRKVVYESPWINFYLDDVEFPNGLVIEKYHFLDYPRDAVAVIVENDVGDVIFVRITRYTTGLAEWELPAGGVDPGEIEIEAARREVLEETGFTTTDHQLLYSYHPLNGSTNKKFHIVHCRAGECVQDFDTDEVSDTRWFTKDEIKRVLRDKALSDGPSVTALLLWLHLTEPV